MIVDHQSYLLPAALGLHVELWRCHTLQSLVRSIELVQVDSLHAGTSLQAANITVELLVRKSLIELRTHQRCVVVDGFTPHPEQVHVRTDAGGGTIVSEGLFRGGRWIASGTAT